MTRTEALSGFMQSPFEDGEMFANPFVAIMELGADLAASGATEEDLIAAGEQLGGAASGRNADRNLSSLAREIIMRQQQERGQGEQ